MNHRSEWQPNSWGMFLIVKCQHASGTCQSHSRPVLSLCEASRKYAELSHSALPFLTLRFHEKDLLPTLRLLQVWTILPLLRHILSVPSRSFGDMGQSDDLVSLLFWDIIDVMDNSTYKLAAFGATSSLGQKVCQILSSPSVHQQGVTHCNWFTDCMVANWIAFFFRVDSSLDELVTWDLLSP